MIRSPIVIPPLCRVLLSEVAANNEIRLIVLVINGIYIDKGLWECNASCFHNKIFIYKLTVLC